MFKKFEPIRHVTLEMPKLDADPGQAIYSVTQKIMTQTVENFDDAICEAIIKIAKESGVSDLFILNKTDILKALVKQMPVHPSNDTCPCGNRMKFWEYDFCPECGQKLKWTEDEE